MPRKENSDNEVESVSKQRRSYISSKMKLVIIREYVDAGFEYASRETEYKGYPIGEWIVYLRAENNRNRIKLTKEDRQMLDGLRKYTLIGLQFKLDLIKEYFDSGFKLQDTNVHTTYKGYPIGEWIIFIRSRANQNKIRLTEKQRELFSGLNLLDKKRVGIDKQIDFLVGWCSKYPEIGIKNWNEEIAKKYCGSQQEYDNLFQQYNIARDYYNYIRIRHWENKLSSEQVTRCKEGNVRGIFGYPAQIESLARYYGISEEKIDYIINKYGSMDAFLQVYKEKKVDEEDINILRSNLRHCIGINSDTGRFSDLDDELIFSLLTRYTNDPYWDKSQNNTYGNIVIFSENELMHIINKDCSSKFRYVLTQLYGLNGEMPKTQAELAEILSVSRTLITNYKKKAILVVRKTYQLRMLHEQSKEFEESDFSGVKDAVFRNNAIFRTDEGYEDRPIVDFSYDDGISTQLGDLISKKAELENKLRVLNEKEKDAEALFEKVDSLLKDPRREDDSYSLE